MPALAQDLDNQDVLMVTSWKERNLNSMPRKSNPERNDDDNVMSRL